MNTSAALTKPALPKQALVFEVAKNELSNTQVIAVDISRPLAENEVLLKVNKFALTANNISYGIAGDALGYWRFFPSDNQPQQTHIRQKTPNKSFMTNNFLINKKLFESIKFDERITEYGHEDTLFGYALKKKNITINHIDNPVINGDIEFNDVYLKKTKEGIVNLIKILEFSTWENDLITDISLLNFHQKIKKVEKLIYISFLISKTFITYFLKKGYVNLHLFDYFKLGTLIVEKRRSEKIKNQIKE